MIELTEEQVRQAFKKAESNEAKGILESLFPDVAKELTKKKPTLDDYTSITSYEDACEALGIDPLPNKEIHNKELNIYDYDGDFIYQVPSHIVALIKLETISRALWGRNWEPKPDAEGRKTLYWPWFSLWAAEEIRDMGDTRKAAILSGYAYNETNAGFGALYACGRASSSYASASLGFRLCQETEEKARYFGSRHFVKLWAEYLQFNFEAGDLLISEQP